MNIKECPKCGEVKSLDQFSVDKSLSSGLRKFCKDCEKQKVTTHKRTKEEL